MSSYTIAFVYTSTMSSLILTRNLIYQTGDQRDIRFIYVLLMT